MAKWKYKIIDSRDVEREGLFKGRAREKLEAYLNELGASGWEIVNVDFNDLTEGHGTFVGIAKKLVQ